MGIDLMKIVVGHAPKSKASLIFSFPKALSNFEEQYHKSLKHFHGLPYSILDSGIKPVSYKITSSLAYTHMDAPIGFV